MGPTSTPIPKHNKRHKHKHKHTPIPQTQTQGREDGGSRKYQSSSVLTTPVESSRPRPLTPPPLCSLQRSKGVRLYHPILHPTISKWGPITATARHFFSPSHDPPPVIIVFLSTRRPIHNPTPAWQSTACIPCWPLNLLDAWSLNLLVELNLLDVLNPNLLDDKNCWVSI